MGLGEVVSCIAVAENLRLPKYASDHNMAFTWCIGTDLHWHTISTFCIAIIDDVPLEETDRLNVKGLRYHGLI